MKKLICLLLALGMLLALCACGEADVSVQTEEAPETTAEATAETAAEPAQPEAAEAGSGEPSGEASAEPSGSASDAPISAANQKVPDHAEPIEAELDEGASYLAFTGDQHGETPGYRVWLEDQLLVYGDQLSLLSYSGDICEKSWVQDVFDDWKAVLDELVPGRYNVTTGNQEFKTGAPGPDWDAIGEGFTVCGEVARTDDYIVYNIGATTETYLFPTSELEAIDDYLNAAPENIPIFVLSHYPLHLACATASHGIPGTDHRQTENNGALIEILNRHPNVVFLWGHNHTFQDPRYGTICPAGSKMTWSYDDPDDKAEINFIYANYGSFCRGDSYGVIAEVLRGENGVDVTLDYIDTNVPMTAKDSAVLHFGTDGTVTAEVTPGSGIDYDEILAMSGWPEDPNFMAELRG